MFKIFSKVKESLDSVSLSLFKVSVWKLNAITTAVVAFISSVAAYNVNNLKDQVKEPLKGDTFDSSKELLVAKQLFSSDNNKLVEQLAIELGKNSSFLASLGQEIAKNLDLQQKVDICVSKKIASSLPYDTDINTGGAIIKRDGTTNFLDC